MVRPVSVHVVVTPTTQATVLDPIVLPTVYVVPSAGTSVTADVVRRRTTIPARSPSPGLVQLTTTCVLPAVTVDPVTFPGDRLSIVTVVPAVSDPAWMFVPVQLLTSAVTA